MALRSHSDFGGFGRRRAALVTAALVLAGLLCPAAATAAPEPPTEESSDGLAAITGPLIETMVVGLSLQDLGEQGVDLTIFEGVSSGLLGDDDISEAAQALEAGCSAGLLVYENVWAAPFAAAMRRAGGQLVASGRIPIQAILAALEAELDD